MIVADSIENKKSNDIKLRWYQEEASEKLISYFDDHDGNPIIVVPTAGGKTIILSEFISQYMTDYPGSKILVLSHIKEILQQDADAISNYFHGYKVGIWSAGLKSKVKKIITVAGIQSIYKKHEEFKDINIVIIDECHLISHKDQGMYRQFLSRLPLANCIGLTATPFRLGHGYINKGNDALFTDIVYDLSSIDNFNRLVSEGYLSKMISKNTDAEWDVKNIRIQAGDFKESDLSVKFDKEAVTNEAVKEIVKYGKNYKCWLVFAIDIQHAKHIASKMIEAGIPTVCIHSEMDSDDRKQAIKDIKNGKYKCTVNVNILTTGFDVPQIDLIAMLRPTQSPVLHVQSIGRGLRVVYAPGYEDNIDGRNAAINASQKKHCLVLDFAGNVERLGPINDVHIVEENENHKKKKLVKVCPSCDVHHGLAVKICDVCGYEFPIAEKQESGKDIKSKSYKGNIVTERANLSNWYDVLEVEYKVHSKKGKPSSLRVIYHCNIHTFSEWVCIDHPPGFAKHRAKSWIRYRLDGEAMPNNLQQLFAIKDRLKKPKQIYVDTSGRFPSINDSKFY